jgi:hypothetical protein
MCACQVANMYARMDVVLGVYWEDDRMFVQPLINEMDWFNSAGVMMRYWPVCAGFDLAYSSLPCQLLRQQIC